jgi:hypothetical protein
MCGKYDVKEVKVPVAHFIMQGVSPRRDVDYFKLQLDSKSLAAPLKKWVLVLIYE